MSQALQLHGLVARLGWQDVMLVDKPASLHCSNGPESSVEWARSSGSLALGLWRAPQPETLNVNERRSTKFLTRMKRKMPAQSTCLATGRTLSILELPAFHPRCRSRRSQVSSLENQGDAPSRISKPSSVLLITTLSLADAGHKSA